jgi:hypothetical protein
MMLNTPSAFLSFYVNTPGANSNATADTIWYMALGASTATRLPRQLFQAVFILAQAAIESALDIKSLLEGHAVMLYKSEDTDWACAIKSGDFDATGWKDKLDPRGNKTSTEESNIMDNKLYLFYSDYLYLFLLMGFNDPTTSESMYLRTGDLIQANMSKVSGGESFLMSKATVYFKLDTKVNVSPLMLALPIASDDTPADFESWAYWSFREEMTRGYQ